MGSSESKSQSIKSRIENNTLIVNDTDIQVMAQNINETISNSIVQTAKTCSLSTIGEQSITIKNLIAKGDINVSTEQQQDQAVTFDCVNSTTARNEASVELINKIMSNLKENNTTNIGEIMNSIAQAKIEQGTLELPSSPLSSKSSSSSTDNEIITRTEVKNNFRTSLNQVVRNAVINNFKTEDVSNAINNVRNGQLVYIDKIESKEGQITAIVSQKQSQEVIFTAIQSSDIGNKIVNALTNGLELQVEKETKTDVKKDITTQSTTSTETDNTMIIIIVVGIVIVSIVALIIYLKMKKKNS